MKSKTHHSRKWEQTWCHCDLCSLSLIKMAQKDHALARFYKTKFIGSRKTQRAKFQVDVKEEGEEGSDLNVQWTLSGELLDMSTVPNNITLTKSSKLEGLTIPRKTHLLSIPTFFLTKRNAERNGRGKTFNLTNRRRNHKYKWAWLSQTVFLHSVLQQASTRTALEDKIVFCFSGRFTTRLFHHKCSYSCLYVPVVLAAGIMQYNARENKEKTILLVAWKDILRGWQSRNTQHMKARSQISLAWHYRVT